MSDELTDLDALFDEISDQRLGMSTEVPQTEELLQAMPLEAAEMDAALAGQGASSGDNSDKQIYERLGGIVRLLHDSLRELGYDRSLSDVASQIGDAKGRLEYVATLTEQAANKVLNAIDEGMPHQDSLSQKAKDIENRWDLVFSGKMGIEEFKTLANDSRSFAAQAVQTSEAEKSRLLDIMMAQDFQDITGQLIKKIVLITHTAEQELAQLLRDHAPAELKLSVTQEKNEKPVDLMQGPDVNGTAMAQDDVDNLLDSLGF
jgi:chemotaxis protein CheZ